MRSASEYNRVKKLLDAGLSEQEVTARTGVPRRTVNNWRHQPGLTRQLPGPEAMWRPWDGEPEVKEAIESLEPWLRARCRPHSRGAAVILEATSPVILHAFPQRGPGRKHLRRVLLAPWQSQLTACWPEALLRGLIHSDGCRTVNRFKVPLPSERVAEYEYPRYFFSNLSDDTRRIFCDHCELIGIRWTQSNPRNISISHRHSVALLERFVGPKRESI